MTRGDGAVAEFEQWIYAHSDELESRIGKQPALEILASNFRSREAVAGVKQLLRDYAERESQLDCRCIMLPAVAVIDMGEESEPVLATIEARRAISLLLVELLPPVRCGPKSLARNTQGRYLKAMDTGEVLFIAVREADGGGAVLLFASDDCIDGPTSIPDAPHRECLCCHRDGD